MWTSSSAEDLREVVTARPPPQRKRTKRAARAQLEKILGELRLPARSSAKATARATGSGNASTVTLPAGHPESVSATGGHLEALRWAARLSIVFAHRGLTGSGLGPVRVTRAESGATIVEVVGPRARMGVAIEPDANESSWYYARRTASGVASESGPLDNFDLNAIVALAFE
jgi:hypothetical protein